MILPCILVTRHQHILHINYTRKNQIYEYMNMRTVWEEINKDTSTSEAGCEALTEVTKKRSVFRDMMHAACYLILMMTGSEHSANLICS
jgi:hypothetical protein